MAGSESSRGRAAGGMFRQGPARGLPPYIADSGLHPHVKDYISMLLGRRQIVEEHINSGNVTALSRIPVPSAIAVSEH